MKKAERTRQLIIEQAAIIFNEKGIAGTTIDDILVATQVAKGCLYGHFETKEQLAYASIDFLLDKLCNKAGSFLKSDKTSVKKLIAFIDLYKNPLNPFIHGGCPLLNFGVESDDTNEFVREKIKKVIDQTQLLLTGIIKTGIKIGELSDDMNARTFPIKMIALLEGGTMMAKTLKDNKPMQDIHHMLKQEINNYVL